VASIRLQFDRAEIMKQASVTATSGYVSETVMTFDKLSNSRRTAVESKSNRTCNDDDDDAMLCCINVCSKAGS